MSGEIVGDVRVNSRPMFQSFAKAECKTSQPRVVSAADHFFH
jgi:hypothetical protein